MTDKPNQLNIFLSKAGIFLITITLILSVFFRFTHLDQKVYSADEVRSILRLTGTSSKQFIEQVFTGDIVSNEEIQKYQRITPDRDLNDSVKALSSIAEHPPLYHLLTRFWMQLFNYPISARVSSILFSLIALPCLYWLCQELFGSSLVGWVGITLVAISPFHILAAQNTTQYSLWTVTILLSSAALLKALRVGSKSSWIVYGAALTMGFYTHLFFTVVAFGYGIYVFIIERFRITKNLLSYLLASLAALLVFLPWLLLIVTNLDKVGENTQYYRLFDNNIQTIVTRFGANLGNVFLDFHNTTRIEKYLDFLIFALVGYSIYYLCRHTNIKVWLFVVILISVTPLVQAIPDLISPSIRSLQARYYLPCFLGIQLAVTYLIANSLSSISLKSWQRYLWQLIFVSLISLGVISGVVISQSRDLALDDQKGTASSVNLQVYPLINKAERPLIISEATHSFILALSYLVDDKVRYQLLKSDDLGQWENKINLSDADNKFTDVFIYWPDDKFIAFMNKDKNFQTELVPLSGKSSKKVLYKIAPKK